MEPKLILDALWRGDVDELSSMLSSVDVNEPVLGVYPFSVAVLRVSPDIEVMELLVGLGANPSVKLSNGISIIDEAKRRYGAPSSIADALDKAVLWHRLNEGFPVQA